MNKEELTTLLMLQGTSHCSCLEHYFLYLKGGGGVPAQNISLLLLCLSPNFVNGRRGVCPRCLPPIVITWQTPMPLRAPACIKRREFWLEYELATGRVDCACVCVCVCGGGVVGCGEFIPDGNLTVHRQTSTHNQNTMPLHKCRGSAECCGLKKDHLCTLEQLSRSPCCQTKS